MSLLLDALKQAELAKAQTGTKGDGDRREPRIDRGAGEDVEPLQAADFKTEIPLDSPTSSQQPLPEALDPSRGKAERRTEPSVAPKRNSQRQAAQLFAAKRVGRTRQDMIRLGLYGVAAVLGLTVGGMYLRDFLMPPIEPRPLAPLAIGHPSSGAVSRPAAAGATPESNGGSSVATPAGATPSGPSAAAPGAAGNVARPPEAAPGAGGAGGAAPPSTPTQVAAASPSNAAPPVSGATAPSAAANGKMVAVPIAGAAAGAGVAAQPAPAAAAPVPKAASSSLPGTSLLKPPGDLSAGRSSLAEPIEDPLPPVKPLPSRAAPARESPVVAEPRIPRSLAGPPRRLPSAAPAVPDTLLALGGDNSIRVRPQTGPVALDPALMEGYGALVRGDYANAKRAYDQVLSTDPTSTDALLGLATIAAASGDRSVALRHYRRVLELDPDNATALAGFAATRGTGGAAGDESTLKSEATRRPDPALYFALGNEYAAQSRWAEAQQSYFDAYRLDTSNPDYAYNLAVALDQLDKLDNALTYYRKADELAGQRGAHFDRAALRSRIGQIQH